MRAPEPRGQKSVDARESAKRLAARTLNTPDLFATCVKQSATSTHLILRSFVITNRGARKLGLRHRPSPLFVADEHGADDPLVPIEAGRDTAANIAGAELIEIPGMGHDLPAALYSRIVDAIESVAKRARVGAS
jgi:hypothetical protein